MECVKKIKVDTSGCLKLCSGLIITSILPPSPFKTEMNQNLANNLPIFEAYENFEKKTQYPTGTNGKQYFLSIICQSNKRMIID